MNIPFSPVWLWPLPVLLVVAAWLRQWWLRTRWMRLRERVEREGIGGLTESECRLARKRWPLSRSWVLLVPALIVAMDIHYFSVPAMEGRVLDLASGEPLAGVTVRRTMTRVGRYYLAEVPSSKQVGPEAEHVTGADGRFEFPRWVALWPSGFKGMSGVQWLAYGPGLMPDKGCIDPIREPFMASTVGCVHVGFLVHDPWAARRWRYIDGTLDLEVKMTRPSDQAGWEETFRRMTILTRGAVLPVERFVELALGYAETNVITEVIADKINSVEGELGGLRGGVPWQRPAALRLFHIVRDYCAENPTPFCSRFDPGYFESRENYLVTGKETP